MYNIMDYTYFFETQANKNIEASDILNTKQLHNFLYIILNLVGQYK